MVQFREIKKGNRVLRILYDENCPNPREWDNLGTMVCFHGRYNLGDKHHYTSPQEFVDEVREDKAIILPLYLYDHSGLAMNTTGFSCPWDSGQVGWIFVTKERVREEYGVKRITRKVRDRVIAALKAEVEEYNQWLQGDVYGFVLEDEEGNMVDSCWGFFGTNWEENGMASCLPENML